MKFTVIKKPTFEAIKTALSEKFPEYDLKMQGKSQLIVKKSASCAVVILIRSNKVIVNGNFPSVGTRLIFTLSMLFLGILIPLIIYLVTFHKKFKVMEKEIVTFLEPEFGGA
jgi:hypothetical protein